MGNAEIEGAGAVGKGGAGAESAGARTEPLPDPVLTLPAGVVASGEYEEKRSRFLCRLTRASSEEEARAFVAEQRKAYPDSRHHCSAFVLDAQSEQPGAMPIARSSDDGEPSGTAGTPMLDQLFGAGLSDVVTVVIRRFGGTKLGTGGLVRAYGDAVALAVADARAAGLVEVVTTRGWSTRIGHDIAGRLEADVRSLGIDVVGTDYAEQVTLRIATDDIGPAASLLAALTAGGAGWVPEPAVRTERAVPLDA
ncbi:IMPACT family protein [Dietzia sp.]|uniref:IMPACT family protein n=1 Tax=Dietzia sp. TaxID=1871616 RepID=UPI002FD9B253